MKLEGEYTFDGPKDEVWKIVRDPEVLATALPGTQSLDRISDNEYLGEINLRVGPVAGVFSGKVIVSDEVPPHSCTLTVEGKGKPGFLNGVGHVELIAQDGGKTLMKYTGDMQVGGRLASVGQRLLDTASKSIISQGLETMNEALKARVASQATGKEVEFTPPSETQFAASVAKNIIGDIFASRTFWIGLAIVLLIIILVVFLIIR